MSAGHFRRKGTVPCALSGAAGRRIPAFGRPRCYSDFDLTFLLQEALSDS